MIICQFIFRPGIYDDEFRRLDAQIDEYARALPGFVSLEVWHSEDRTEKNAIYRFESMDDVKALATYPQHLEAKEKNARWYESYRVVISEELRTYGARS
ncbi:MAG: hypothetical protein RLZZ600_1152 [Actinomycetota bacterium]|jgi:heme-degrading monooxygenase HmoA